MREPTHKVYCYITHGSHLLVFRHPHAPIAGIQVPGGTLEAGEAPMMGALREAREETGLEGLRLRAFLGEVDFPVHERGETHRRHFYHLTCEEEPPERWRTVETDPSEGDELPVFEHYWVAVPDGVPELAPGHDAFLGALWERLRVWEECGPWEPLSPTGVRNLFADAPFPWWVSGGWAIDLFLGRQTRPHEDMDVQILHRDHQAARRVLGGWDLHHCTPRGLEPWAPHEPLPEEVHGLWCRPAPEAPWALELMLSPAQHDRCLFRRDERVSRSLAEVGRVNAEGIRYLAPEVQLLFKAKARQPKDEADLATTLPSMPPGAVRWLVEALATVYPDGHPWRDRLSRALTA